MKYIHFELSNLIGRLERTIMYIYVCLCMSAAGHKDCDRVQDPYSMRCVPQVHGVVHDTIQFVQGVITTEMNSAQDNPVSEGRET